MTSCCLDHTYDELQCIFWDVVDLDWSDEGCVKGIEEGIFFCNCTHLTSFSVGPVVISANFIDPSDANLLNQLLTTQGGIIALSCTCVFFGLYVLLFPLMIYLDRRERRQDQVPSPEDLQDFVNKFGFLYKRKPSILVLETRRLDEWIRIFEIKRASDPNYKPRIWDVLRVHLKDGFRQQHLYISMFFKPIGGYTRPQRVTIIFTILFISLAVNAFLFQYNSDQQISIPQRLIAAILSSVIVFVPTTIHGFLFRRCRVKGQNVKYIEQMTPEYIAKLGIDMDKVAKRNWFHRVFVDWHLPWYWNCVLYGGAYISWIFSIYVTLLYGIKFRDEKAVAYFESFLISLAISIGVLQTAKAVVGGIFVTVTSGAITVAFLAAIGVGELFALQ